MQETQPAEVADPPAPAKTSLQLWAIAAALCLLIVLGAWPGSMIGDNVRQLREIRAGQLTDWHPPLMSVIWRQLGTAPQSILILNAIIYWTGFALLADQLRREAGRRWAFGMLAVGLSPISVFYLGTIQKDTLLTALFVLAAGLIARFGRAHGLIPAFLGMLARANAVFAAPPLFIRTRRLIPAALICIALSLALIPVSTFINRSLLGAKPSHVEKSLQLFDIAGIGDPKLARCYSPFEWDTLELHCRAFERSPDDLSEVWLKAIGEHPLAYARHRLSYFNHTIFFLVPPLQECVLIPQDEPSCSDPGAHPLLNDAIGRNALVWPVTWLVVGFILLLLPLEPLARALTLSGMLYGLAYLFVGVATGFRYFYWTELAVQIALRWQLAHGLPRWRWIVVAVMAVWIAGYAYRYVPMLVSDSPPISAINS